MYIKIKTLLKQMLCSHVWTPIYERNNYLREDGFIVHVWQEYCQHCGKYRYSDHLTYPKKGDKYK